MKKQPNKKTVAMFIILGVLVFAGIIFKQLEDKFFTEKNLAVMYFNESIKGLSIGSPVVYEGVQVGKVVDIQILTDPRTWEFSIPVYVHFDEAGDISGLAFEREMTRHQILLMLINKGLRARLGTQNYLTGQLMIELLMLPNTPINMHLEGVIKGAFEIPTVLSPFAGLTKDFNELPLRDIVERINNVLKNFEEQLPVILPNMASFSQKLNGYVSKSAPQTAQTFNQLDATLKDVGAAAKSVKNLTDYLERHPDALLKGKK